MQSKERYFNSVAVPGDEFNWKVFEARNDLRFLPASLICRVLQTRREFGVTSASKAVKYLGIKKTYAQEEPLLEQS
jgi:hypothetical protein